MNGGKVPQNRPNPALIASQEVKAYNLAAKGFSIRAIARQLTSPDKPEGVSPGTAHSRLKGALDRIPDADIATARRLALTQYEHMVDKLRRAHKLGRISTRDYISEWRLTLKEVVRLLGLNAPTRISLIPSDPEIEFDPTGEMAAIIAEAQAEEQRQQADLENGDA